MTRNEEHDQSTAIEKNTFSANTSLRIVLDP